VECPARRGLAKIAGKLKPLGQKWVDAFASLYLPENDKQRLPNILQQIFAAAPGSEYARGRLFVLAISL